jgi:hypothetical protein
MFWIVPCVLAAFVPCSLLLFFVPVGLCSCAASGACGVCGVSLCCWVGSDPCVCRLVSCLLSCHFLPFPSESFCNKAFLLHIPEGVNVCFFRTVQPQVMPCRNPVGTVTSCSELHLANVSPHVYRSQESNRRPTVHCFCSE